MNNTTENSSQQFVFAVCGSSEHIDALHISLEALRRFSAKEVIVVTDTTRNEKEIQHHNVVDVATPASFTTHQASIYLKTSLYKFLPHGNHYCYLDTDVVAVDDQVDAIFEQFVPPITFAKDHCTIDEFSAFAITCDCHANGRERKQQLFATWSYYQNHREAELQEMMHEIDRLTEANKQHWLLYAWHWMRYHLGDRHFYHLNNKYKLHKKSGQWMTQGGELISDQTIENYIREKTGLIWDEASAAYLTPDGSDPFPSSCSHLRNALKDKWGLKVGAGNWQHWNGGVFLFNDQSHEFMADWHNKTLQIFEDTDWITRDQGALVATTWQKECQNHPTIERAFNFIVDYDNSNLQYLGDLRFQEGNTIYKPHFLHLIEHFGDPNWSLWQDIKGLVSAAHS